MTDELDVILWDAFEEELQKSATHGNPLWDVLIEDGPQEPAYPAQWKRVSDDEGCCSGSVNLDRMKVANLTDKLRKAKEDGWQPRLGSPTAVQLGDPGAVRLQEMARKMSKAKAGNEGLTNYYYSKLKRAKLAKGTSKLKMAAGIPPQAGAPMGKGAKAAIVALSALLSGGAVAGGAALVSGKKGRKRMKAELQDPRFKHNVKGMLMLKSRKDRVAGHAALREQHPKSRFMD